MTVIRRLAAALTDAADLPLAVPSAGVSGSAYRWRAADLSGSDGDAIAAWSPAVGEIDLVQATAANKPLLKIENGVRMLRFDGTNDELTPASTLVAGNLHTITLLTRVRAAQGSQHGILNTSTGAIQRGGGSPTATTNVNGGGTGATNTAVAVDPTSTTIFHCMSFALGLDQSSVAVRSVTIGATTAAVNGDAEPTTIRIGQGFLGTFGNIDVLEVITWPFALTTTQRAAVRTQMQAVYPGLVA